MEKFGKVIVKLRIPILILSFLLLIPSAIGYFNTRVNYDILYYLPNEIETMQGQDILMDDFNKGAYAMVVVQNMDTKSTDRLIKKVENVDHVAQVISYTGIVGEDVPSEIVPSKFRKYFENDSTDTTLFAIFFDNTTSSDDTMNAIIQIREQTEGQAFISGMSAVVTDTKNLSEKETPLYVLIAVVLVCIVLAIFMDSFLVPVFFMISIGMAIVYNLGSNILLGEVSYITKALAAVLQLGVTLDYSIFLWHSYKEMKEIYPDDHKEAMAVAISNTLTSVVGSSITTVAGFIALCFMSFTLGLDLGIVMAKGVVFGVIGCVTILPSLILTFDRALEKTMHREIMPNFDKLATFIVNHSWIFVIVFVVLLGPAIYGQNHTSVYYDLSDTLPDDLACSQANKKLEENFDMNSIYMILADSSMSTDTANEMLDKLGDVDGVQFALGLDTALKSGIPQEFLPAKTVSELKGEDYQIMMIATDYKIASDEINNQISKVNDIVKSYDSKAMVVGEAPCTKDLITITDKDFKTVSAVSIGIIFLIIFAVYVLMMVFQAMRARNNQEVVQLETMENEELMIMSYPKSLLCIVGGAAAIAFGGDLTVDAASRIAIDFGMSQNLVGLTIVSIGTSLPELVTSIVAARKNEVDMAVGNAIGSNIFNILMVLGIAAAISPVAFLTENIIDIAVLIVFSVIGWIMAWTKRELNRKEGIIMLLLYAVYVVYICMR